MRAEHLLDIVKPKSRPSSGILNISACVGKKAATVLTVRSKLPSGSIWLTKPLRSFTFWVLRTYNTIFLNYLIICPAP